MSAAPNFALIEGGSLPAIGPRKLINFARLDRIDRKPLESVIEGFLYADTLASVVGKSGSCKSFLVQGMCASVATGSPWMGRRVEQGAVFYIGGEGQAGIRKRFDGWSKYTGVSLAEAPLYVASGLPSLCEAPNTDAVITEIHAAADEVFFSRGAFEPKLVVVDTLARAMAGSDENSAADMGNLIGALDCMRREWGCCVLAIHHTGHGEKERGRGSSAYYGALDSELLVSSNGTRVTVRSTKEKDWTKPAEVCLDRHVVDVAVEGSTETTLVLDQAACLNEAQAVLSQRREINDLKNKGLSIRAIANELGVSKAKVEYTLGTKKTKAGYEGQKDGE